MNMISGEPVAEQSTWWVQLLYMFPQVPFAVLCLDWMVPDGAEKMLNLEVKWAWVASVVNFFLYLALYHYLDAVLPNSFGVRRHLCFCLKKDNKRQEATEVVEYESSGDELVQDHRANKTIVRMKNLSKTYGKLKAVDRLNLTMD